MDPLVMLHGTHLLDYVIVLVWCFSVCRESRLFHISTEVGFFPWNNLPSVKAT